MRISAERGRNWSAQLFLMALFAAVILGLILTYQGGRSAALYWALLAGGLFFTPRPWLRNLRAVLLQWWDLDRRRSLLLLLTVFAATFAACFAVHGFLFANEFFSHDSVTMTNYDSVPRSQIYYYISLGRPMLPLYETLKGPASAPWLVGLLFLLWTTLASVLIVRLLGLQSATAVVLASALVCSNPVLINTGATYIYCMDEYALALLMAAAAAWSFCRCGRSCLPGIVCLVISMSLYQAYFAVAAVLCFLTLLPEVLEGEKPLLTVRKGLCRLAMLAAGFAAYFLTWSAACRITGQEKSRVGETILSAGPVALIKKVAAAYRDLFEALWRGNTMLGRIAQAVGLLLLALILLWFAGWLADKRLPRGNKALLIAALCMLPAVFNVTYILFQDWNQPLVNFPRGLTGVFLLFCAVRWPAVPLVRRYRAAALLLATALLWQNTVTANQIYIKKDLEKTATASVVTRIIERVEQMDGYVPGETPVAFSGALNDNALLSEPRDPFRDLSFYYEGVSAIRSYAATYNIDSYIKIYLHYPMNITYIHDPLEEIAEMPAFPSNGSVAWVGDVIVVKLG